jgi:hypothetical protein
MYASMKFSQCNSLVLLIIKLKKNNKKKNKLGVVMHSCNSNYMGDGDRRNHDLRLARAKMQGTS